MAKSYWLKRFVPKEVRMQNNRKECKHGNLKRQYELCERDERIHDLMEDINKLRDERFHDLIKNIKKLRETLIKIRYCDFAIPLPGRMDRVREYEYTIAQEFLTRWGIDKRKNDT